MEIVNICNRTWTYTFDYHVNFSKRLRQAMMKFGVEHPSLSFEFKIKNISECTIHIEGSEDDVREVKSVFENLALELTIDEKSAIVEMDKSLYKHFVGYNNCRLNEIYEKFDETQIIICDESVIKMRGSSAQVDHCVEMVKNTLEKLEDSINFLIGNRELIDIF